MLVSALESRPSAGRTVELKFAQTFPYKAFGCYVARCSDTTLDLAAPGSVQGLYLVVYDIRQPAPNSSIGVSR